MAYFKAIIRKTSYSKYNPPRVIKEEGGFYSHSITGIFKNGADKTTIRLDSSILNTSCIIELNLPIEDVHKIFSYLEIYPGVADLLDASNPKNKEKVKHVEVHTAQRGKHKITLG